MREAGGELARAVTDEEYELVLDCADDLGFTQMYWQEGGASGRKLHPCLRHNRRPPKAIMSSFQIGAGHFW